jgi:hypothetical protein
VSSSRFFVHFSGENFGENSAEIFHLKKCWGKLEFYAKKVLKNSFAKKFRRKFHGKSLSTENHFPRKKCTNNSPQVELTGMECSSAMARSERTARSRTMVSSTVARDSRGGRRQLKEGGDKFQGCERYCFGAL